MQVIEKFVSLNGEGTHAGELAAFIRFKGCNLNCSYCDTKYANEERTEAVEMSPEELTAWVKSEGIKNVTLTGGEPLLQDRISELAEMLLENGCRVEFETNGSVSVEAISKLRPRPFITMDYKLPSSGMEGHMRRDNFDFLSWTDTVKFVAGSVDDLETARRIIEKYRLCERCHVYISPVFGKIKPETIAEYMIQHRMNGVRLQLQIHKIIWEPDRRGV